jgi:hypothetical protein
MTIAYESITLAVGTVKGDRHHEDSSFLNCLTFSEPIISCRFVPLPKFGYAAQTRAFSQALTIASTLFWLGTYLVQAGFTLAGGCSSHTPKNSGKPNQFHQINMLVLWIAVEASNKRSWGYHLRAVLSGLKPRLGMKPNFCSPFPETRREKEAEAHEMSLLRSIYNQETSQENRTRFPDLLLLNVPTNL